MKFNLPVSLIEYKLDKVEWFDSMHGWPAIRLHVSEAHNDRNENQGTFTMACFDLDRIVRERPAAMESQLGLTTKFDDTTERVIAAFRTDLGDLSSSDRGILAEVISRLRASGISDDTIGEWLMEPTAEGVTK